MARLKKPKPYGRWRITEPSRPGGKFTARYRPMVHGLRRDARITGGTLAETRSLIDAWWAAGGFDAVVLPSTGMTVAEYLIGWWAECEPKLAATTRDSEGARFRKYLQGDKIFSALVLTEVTKLDVKSWLSRIKASDNTKRVAWKLLRRAFKAAVLDDIIPGNPCDIANPPRAPKRDTDQRVFTPDEEASLLRFVATRPEWDGMVRIALDSGARQAELFALECDDFDLTRGEVRISKTVDTLRGLGAVAKKGAKTASSVRRVPLGQSTLAALRPMLLRARKHVFTDAAGRLWSRHSFRDAWRKLLKQADLPLRGFHATRHTCATRLLKSGVSVVLVSKRLGHSTPTLTLNVYSHALPEDQAACASAFDAAYAQYLTAAPQAFGPNLAHSEVA